MERSRGRVVPLSVRQLRRAASRVRGVVRAVPVLPVATSVWSQGPSASAVRASRRSAADCAAVRGSWCSTILARRASSSKNARTRRAIPQPASAFSAAIGLRGRRRAGCSIHPGTGRDPLAANSEIRSALQGFPQLRLGSVGRPQPITPSSRTRRRQARRNPRACRVCV